MAADLASVAGFDPALIARRKKKKDWEEDYTAAVSDLQVAEAELDGHTFAAEAAKEGAQPRERTKRLQQEIADLSKNLPLHADSTIYVRVDTRHNQLWRVLIVGPPDTPYSGGLFFFDLYMPPKYPAIPPQALFLTTGGGKVRFNPNLYNCGKVCLSLLGTWSGPPWQANVSSILQLLVSIQGMILVPDPFYNEPGFTPSASLQRQADEYTRNIREQTMRYAILDPLKSNPRYFKPVVKKHFKIRWPVNLKVCLGWMDPEADPDARRRTRMRAILDEVLELLLPVKEVIEEEEARLQAERERQQAQVIDMGEEERGEGPGALAANAWMEEGDGGDSDSVCTQPSDSDEDCVALEQDGGPAGGAGGSSSHPVELGGSAGPGEGQRAGKKRACSSPGGRSAGVVDLTAD